MKDEKQKTNSIGNTSPKDSSAKLIFDNHILCAQFLRDYVDVELLKDVQPEDIEDISERFLWLWQESRESGSVKKIHLKGKEGADTLFVITLIEHQSRVDHDMILPIVFYDGPGMWTAAVNFQERVYLNETLGEYIPSFRYLVVPLSRYTNEELIGKKDELSLVMLVDKLQSAADFRTLKELPEGYLEEIARESPESVLKLIGKILAVLLVRLNVPREEVEEFTDRIERREFGMLFEHFEAYDVQETRRVSREEGREEGREEARVALVEAIQELLADKGTIPKKEEEIIRKETDLEILKKWLKQAARASSVEGFVSEM